MTRATKTRLIVYSAIVGLFLALALNPIQLGSNTTKQQQPLAHHFSKHPDTLTLRFAQVHDVVHERFPHHGAAYYEARNQSVQNQLQRAKPGSDEYDKLIDDLAVGFLRTGKPAEAIDLMRKKLEEQIAAGKSGKQLYSTYANLGTFLILYQFQLGLDKPEAKERVRESIDWIKKAVAVKPEAHFGREQWQLVLEQFLLAVMDNPKLLLEYDMIGNRLDRRVRGGAHTDNLESWGTFLKAHPHLADDYVNKRLTPEQLEEIRRHITKVGAETDWNKDVGPISEPAPFDEPTLGIIGMWTMGAGANPYFALALGETMLRVGQRYIAWDAYERAIDTKDMLWPDQDIKNKFVAHCRERQALIEQSLPESERGQFRKRYRAELQHGKDYQKAYEEYERQQIAAGISIDDPHFFDKFHEAKEKIATSVGEEDRFYTYRHERPHIPLPGMLLGAGLLAFVTALVVSRFPTITPAPLEEEATETPANEATPPAPAGSQAAPDENPALPSAEEQSRQEPPAEPGEDRPG